MRITFSARNGASQHAVACVMGSLNVLRGNRLPEAGPAGARFKFGLRTEQRVIATNASVEPFIVQVPILSAEGHFSIGVTRDVKGIFGELLLPFRIGLHYL